MFSLVQTFDTGDSHSSSCYLLSFLTCDFSSENVLLTVCLQWIRTLIRPRSGCPQSLSVYLEGLQRGRSATCWRSRHLLLLSCAPGGKVFCSVLAVSPCSAILFSMAPMFLDKKDLLCIFFHSVCYRSEKRGFWRSYVVVLAKNLNWIWPLLSIQSRTAYTFWILSTLPDYILVLKEVSIALLLQSS